MDSSPEMLLPNAGKARFGRMVLVVIGLIVGVVAIDAAQARWRASDPPISANGAVRLATHRQGNDRLVRNLSVTRADARLVLPEDAGRWFYTDAALAKRDHRLPVWLVLFEGRVEFVDREDTGTGGESLVDPQSGEVINTLFRIMSADRESEWRVFAAIPDQSHPATHSLLRAVFRF